MTIRRRLELSFLAILLLFGLSLLVYFLSSQRRSVSVEELRRAISRQVLVTSIAQNLRDMQKQVALLSQVVVEAAASGAGPEQIAQFDSQLEVIRREARELHELSDPDSRAAVESFQALYTKLSVSWQVFYKNFGVNQTKAIVELASNADPLSQRIVQDVLPRLQADEERRVEAARQSFYYVAKLTNRITIFNFIISTVIAVSVAYFVSRYLTRAINELRTGAYSIGAGNLDFRLAIKSRDELGELAQAFNEMAEGLRSARQQLMQANQQLERRNLEVEEQKAVLSDLSRNMEQLYLLSTTMQEPLSLKEHLTRVLESARKVVEVDRFYSWVLSPDGDKLTALAGAGFSEEEGRVFMGMEIPLTEAGAMGKAYKEGAPLVFNEEKPLPPDLRLKPPYSEISALRAKNFMLLPMIARGRTVGILTADNKWSRQPIRPHTVDLLQIFASHAAVAIENARLFREIEQKGALLEIASKHKSQFLANMSHELRTPLNAILGYTELIRDNIYGDVPAKISEVLERVNKSGRHLLGLINDVLDLAKIEAGRITLSLSDYSMKEVVHSVITSVESLAAEKKLALRVGLLTDLPVGKGDERRIMQVLLNLVGNAIKFTDAGEVLVRATVSDGRFEVSVSDTGPGISDADQQKIFKEFQQADSSSTRKKGGTGLGLSIARKIIELHGGHMWVESVLGKGSTFRFTLPVRVEGQMETK